MKKIIQEIEDILCGRVTITTSLAVWLSAFTVIWTTALLLGRISTLLF